MKSEANLLNRVRVLLLLIAIGAISGHADTIPSMFSLPLEWRIGGQVTAGGILRSNAYLKGDNEFDKKAGASVGGNVRADFSFNPSTREGMLYKGLYQGIGIGVNSYSPSQLLGTPISMYVFQGMPIAHLSRQITFGYEWEFGAAFGWKHYDANTSQSNVAVGSSVTAHMGIKFKIDYKLSQRWVMTLGVGANHYSNGNTAWPNGGVNTLGGTVGIAYILNPQTPLPHADSELRAEADRRRWMFDIIAYGAWRKRAVTVDDPPEPMLCPGKFGVAGVQFAPLYCLNRFVAIGPSLDLQRDESGGLEPYWVEGSYYDNIKFERPLFGKQISAGLSAHAELTLPIFSVNAGLGFDMVTPKGDHAFYQSLTLKTFVTKKIFINAGYRLGNFKTPRNLMLGFGVRL